MAADPRSFFKLHNGMPEHPKVAGLDDAAFRALIELWCYCSRNLTDGHVAGAMANRLAGATALASLVTAGLVDDCQGECATGGCGGYVMHDYLEHQQSKAEVEVNRENKRKAGSLGGHARARALAGATAGAKQVLKQTSSRNVPDTDTDTDTERGARKRATALPKDWQPTPEHVARAREDGVDLGREVMKFRAWADEGNTSKSWNSRFARWLMSAAEYQAKQGNGRPPAPAHSPWDNAARAPRRETA